jgi:hypothetical protein
MSSKKGSPSSCWSSERLIEIESDSKESVLNTVVMPLQYPTGVGEEMAVGFAALRQMPSLRRGGWLFAYDGLVFALHSLTFHNFAQKFSRRGLDAFLAFQLGHHGDKMFEPFVGCLDFLLLA